MIASNARFEYTKRPSGAVATQMPAARSSAIAAMSSSSSLDRTASNVYRHRVSKEEAPEVLAIEGRDVKVTHPSKLYFEEAKLTKLDLVRYYLSVAEGALRGIRDRP